METGHKPMLFELNVVKTTVSAVFCVKACWDAVPVNAGLGVSQLVETGHFKSKGIPSLAFVHVVAKGQDDL